MTEIKGKMRKKLGLGYIIAAAFFLFNPDIVIIDLIPDVFGYLLLILGISEFAELNEKIKDAKSYFIKAAVCNLIKFGLIFVLFGFVTPQERPVSMLLFVFVMNLFDLIYLVPGYINLFGGLVYLGERLDGDFVLKRKVYLPRKMPEGLSAKKQRAFQRKEILRKWRCEKSLSKTEKIRKATLIFVFFKAVSPVLPEFTSLLNYEYSDSLVNYYNFIGLYRVFSVMIMLIVGAVWLVRFVRYFSGVKRDSVFMSALKEKYNAEVLPNRIYFTKRFVWRERILFACAAFFCVNLYFDTYNILPNIIAAVLFAIASFGIRRYTSKWKYCFVSSALLGVASVIAENKRNIFNSEFIYEQIMRNPDAYDAWEELLYSSYAEAICMSMVVISAIICANSIAIKYTGYFNFGSDSYDPARATKELHAELCRPFILTGMFGIFSALCIPAYVYSLAINAEAVWILGLVFALLFAVSFSYNIHEVTRNINYGHFLGDE